MTQDRLIFLIGVRRCQVRRCSPGMLGAHSAIVRPAAEPHLIMPIPSHTSATTQRAEGALRPVQRRAASDSSPTCRAAKRTTWTRCAPYTDTMYERMLSTATGKRFFLDKTPRTQLVAPLPREALPRREVHRAQPATAPPFSARG